MNAIKSKFRISSVILLYCLISFAQASLAAEDGKQAGNSTTAKDANKEPDYIAIVGDERVGIGEYMGALRKGVRERFYHGKTPEDEMKKFRKEVAEKLVDRLLSIQEGKRRGIKPDTAKVKKGVDAFDAQFKDDPKWQEAREEVLKQLKWKLEGDSISEQLEQQVRAVTAPNSKDLTSFYNDHKDLFTTPERIRVSMIMLKVDPSSPSDVWQQASEEAASIVEKMNKGTDFEDMARIHSGDKSAQDGGNMGFIHSGMLGENAQKVLDLLEPGEISAPVILLEGVAIFRLDERVKPMLNPLESVRERATKVYQRNTGEQAWKDLITSLRTKTRIEYNDAPWR